MIPRNQAIYLPCRQLTEGYRFYDTTEGYGSRREWRSHFYERMSGDQAKEILENEEEAPWQILKVAQGSTKKEIKKAYRALMFIWHPDYNPKNIEEATAMSKKINAAYAIMVKK